MPHVVGDGTVGCAVKLAVVHLLNEEPSDLFVKRARLSKGIVLSIGGKDMAVP